MVLMNGKMCEWRNEYFVNNKENAKKIASTKWHFIHDGKGGIFS